MDKTYLKAHWKKLLRDLHDVDFEFRMAIVNKAPQDVLTRIGRKRRNVNNAIRATKAAMAAAK